MMKELYSISLDELCARVIYDIRRLLVELRKKDIAANSTDREVIRRSMDCMSNNDIGVGAYEQIDPVISILQRELDCETVDMRRVFTGRNDEEEGAVGSIKLQRTLTERGNHIENCLVDLRRLHMELWLNLGDGA